MPNVVLMKAEYKAVDITRYYVSVAGATFTEVNHASYTDYLSSGVVVNTDSEEFDDRFIVIKEMDVKL